MDIAINNALIPDFTTMQWHKGHIGIENSRIVKISQHKLTAKYIFDLEEKVVSPGLMDCHCHIESSYLTPYYFGQLVAKYGTLEVVADCHEIANVAGLDGVKYFLENARLADINIKFAASSCVPASNFTKGGGVLFENDISELLLMDEVVALGEVMNINGVLNKDKKLISIISLAKKLSKRVNGHAAGLRGDDLLKYIQLGNIEDDHESEGYEEIEEKLKAGLKIFLREGSAASTELRAYKLAERYPDDMMYCTDDKTAADILEDGHINFHLRKAVSAGLDPLLAIKLGAYNGFKYYNIEGGSIKEGCPANLVVFKDLKSFKPHTVIIHGNLYREEYKKFNIPKSLLYSLKVVEPVIIPEIKESVRNFAISLNRGSLITDKVQLTTLKSTKPNNYINKKIDDDVLEKDILKIINIDRYGRDKKAAALIKGFGLKKGAIGSSLSHDCHNIIAVGTSDNNLMAVVKKILQINGGLVCYNEKDYYILSLNIGGIISEALPQKIKMDMNRLNKWTKDLGCKLEEPFAMLSFMALEVIPHIKITADGLFDVDLNEFL